MGWPLTALEVGYTGKAGPPAARNEFLVRLAPCAAPTDTLSESVYQTG